MSFINTRTFALFRMRQSPTQCSLWEEDGHYKKGGDDEFPWQLLDRNHCSDSCTHQGFRFDDVNHHIIPPAIIRLRTWDFKEEHTLYKRTFWKCLLIIHAGIRPNALAVKMLIKKISRIWPAGCRKIYWTPCNLDCITWSSQDLVLYSTY